jgi:uncharacterized protein (TIGR02246 family)
VHPDEQAIRDLIADWLRATVAGDLPRLLTLMSEDVIFLAPGQPVMRGKEAFASAFRAASARVRLNAVSEIQEIRVEGQMAYCWNHFVVTTMPIDGGPSKQRTGYTLTILRKTRLGTWVVTRDANMMSLE